MMCEASHGDPLTTALRKAQWQPTGPMPCGCWPKALCHQHANLRAVEHYHPETIPR